MLKTHFTSRRALIGGCLECLAVVADHLAGNSSSCDETSEAPEEGGSGLVWYEIQVNSPYHTAGIEADPDLLHASFTLDIEGSSEINARKCERWRLVHDGSGGGLGAL